MHLAAVISRESILITNCVPMADLSCRFLEKFKFSFRPVPAYSATSVTVFTYCEMFKTSNVRKWSQTLQFIANVVQVH